MGLCGFEAGDWLTGPCYVFMRQLAVPTATHLPIQYSVPCDERFGGLSVECCSGAGVG